MPSGPPDYDSVTRHGNKCKNGPDGARLELQGETPHQATSNLIALEEALELVGTTGVPQFSQRLGLDLAYTLARYIELLADLFESLVGAHFDTETHAQHLGFARCE